MFMARLLSRLSLVGTNQVYRTWSRCRYPIRPVQGILHPRPWGRTTHTCHSRYPSRTDRVPPPHRRAHDHPYPDSPTAAIPEFGEKVQHRLLSLRELASRHGFDDTYRTPRPSFFVWTSLRLWINYQHYLHNANNIALQVGSRQSCGSGADRDSAPTVSNLQFVHFDRVICPASSAPVRKFVLAPVAALWGFLLILFLFNNILGSRR